MSDKRDEAEQWLYALHDYTTLKLIARIKELEAEKKRRANGDDKK